MMDFFSSSFCYLINLESQTVLRFQDIFHYNNEDLIFYLAEVIYCQFKIMLMMHCDD